MKNDLSDQMAKILREWSDDFLKDLETTKEEIAEIAVDKVSKKSPEDKGTYKKNWVIAKRKDEIIIHQQKEAGLTHLLEKGFLHTGGKHIKAQVHIEPVQEYVEDEIFKRLKKRLEG